MGKRASCQNLILKGVECQLLIEVMKGVRDHGNWVLSKKRFGCSKGHLSIWVNGVESPLIFLYKNNNKKKNKYKLHDQSTSLSLIE